MPQDPVADRLRRAPINDRLRADAWDAFAQARDPDDLAQRLSKITMPDAVKADLWDLKAGMPPKEPPVREKAPPLATLGEIAQSRPSATRRFLAGAGEMLNPVTMVKGVAQAVAHPIDTVSHIYDAQVDQAAKAFTAGGEGRYSEMAGHAGAALLPLIGPAAAAAGEQIGGGDIAGGIGTGVGLIGQMAIPTAVRAGKRAMRSVVNPSTLEAAAAARVTDVMTPRVGANKVRLGNRAAAVAPELVKDLAKDGAPLTKGSFHANVQAKLAEAEQALDAASDARLAARSFPTKPIMDALKAKRAQFTAKAPEASKTVQDTSTRTSALVDESGRPIVVTDAKAVPLGKDVIPAPSRARVSQIDQAIKELEQLGPQTTYDAIKKIRQSYDGPAKAVYSPAVTVDYLKAQGGAHGAADVTGVLRETLAKWDPETAAANAQYSLYRTADDVLKAAAEVERARPKLFRQVMGRLTGVLVGSSSGAPGAVAGYVGAAALDSAMAAGVTSQLKTAALLQKLATAIRKGDMGQVNAATAQLKRLAPAAAVEMGRTTSPTAGQLQPAGARP